MVHLKSCWTPCFWHNNVLDGSVAVAVYTMSMSVCLITYTSYVISGGDSSQLWLPFFETNLNTTSQPVGIFIILYLAVLTLASALLIFAVFTFIRGLFIPWFVQMFIVVLFQAMFGLWLLFGYYIYLEMVFAALCDFTWMGLNIYCILVVRSHYYDIKVFQSPDIEYLHDY